MTITPLPGMGAASEADEPLSTAGSASPGSSATAGFASALSHAFASASDALERADRSEHAFARGTGGLQEMVLDRAQASVALSIASSAASHASQALSTILGMQI